MGRLYVYTYMSKDYEKLFSRLRVAEPSVNLLGKITDRVRRRETFLIYQKTAFYSLGVAFSLTALVFSLRSAQAGFAESGFFQFFSLVFTDFKIVAASWQSFALSLLETIPASGLIFTLSSLFVFMSLLKQLIKNASFIFIPTPKMLRT